MLGAASIASVLQHAAERGPTSLQLMDAGEILRGNLLALMPADPPPPPQTSTQSTQVYLAGEVLLRARHTTAPILTSNTGCAHSGTSLQATFEQALFAPLFPNGRSFYTGVGTLPGYVRMRCMALFTSFTLVKPYILVMYQLRQACVLA